jgi:hypothetical protein
MATGRTLAALPLVVLGAHCALAFDPDDLGAGAEPLAEAGRGDAPIDVPGAIDARGSTGLDVGVALPDLNAATCDPAGRATCGDGACRLATRDSGRCESCSGGRCAVKIGRTCAESRECDVQLDCFRGRCTPTCLLGQLECGLAEDCLDVGYVGLGLCDPSKL